jgi:hypothetical protein
MVKLRLAQFFVTVIASVIISADAGMSPSKGTCNELTAGLTSA